MASVWPFLCLDSCGSTPLICLDLFAHEHVMKQSSSRSLAIRIALTYAFFGALWILFSDQIVAVLVGDAATLTQLQTLKGWFYVTVTAALVYVLVERGARMEIDRREQAKAERERLIGELEARNTELEQFAYTVSHDLKAPLITVTSYIGALREDLADGDQEAIDDDLQRMNRAACKMVQLLDDVLQLSRVGRLCEPSLHAPMAELVGEALELVLPPFEEHGIHVDIEPDLPVLFGDRQRLVQVFQNLIDNAAKFVRNREHPRIEITGRLMEGEVICVVRDNGIGIAPRHHDRVFGLFEQLDPKAEGTGVGLALVKRIIDVHGGRIWIESEGEGRGCSFCFSLPFPQGDTH